MAANAHLPTASKAQWSSMQANMHDSECATLQAANVASNGTNSSGNAQQDTRNDRQGASNLAAKGTNHRDTGVSSTQQPHMQCSHTTQAAASYNPANADSVVQDNAFNHNSGPARETDAQLRPQLRVLTSSTEFYSVTRQLNRLMQAMPEHIAVDSIPVEPFDTFPERLLQQANAMPYDVVYVSQVTYLMQVSR